MQFKAFSEKQRQVLTWWCDGAGTRDREAIICDGAVRSGKTLCMGLSFFCWAMRRFGGEKFALCGKTVSALRRNHPAAGAGRAWVPISGNRLPKPGARALWRAGKYVLPLRRSG